MSEIVEGLPEEPAMLKKGDWIVCANDHRNWRVTRDVGAEGPKADDFVSPNGLKPTPGKPVAPCSICGEPLIVNGNQGLRFRVVRKPS
jgi:hypothetical protein